MVVPGGSDNTYFLVQFWSCRLGKGQLIVVSLVEILFVLCACLSSGMYCGLCIPGQTWGAHLALLSLAVGPWTSCLTSLSLHFLICKIVILYHPEVGLILLEKELLCCMCLSRKDRE